MAQLIMNESHYEDHMSSATDVLARSRRRVWIVRGRYLAKEIIKGCPVCKLRRRKLTQQIMADIPSHQLYPCPPFSHVSLDFAVPFLVRAMGNSRAQLKRLRGLLISLTSLSWIGHASKKVQYGMEQSGRLCSLVVNGGMGWRNPP